MARSRTPQRRRGDWAESPTMIETVRFLISRPQVDQIAQFLVLHLLGAHQPMSAVVSTFGADGSLHAVSTFGNPPGGVEAYRSLSLWDAMPMCASVRADGVTVVTQEDLADSYPGLARQKAVPAAIAAAPLAVPGEPVGALQLSLATVPDLDALTRDLSGVTAVLALYLDLTVNAARAVPGAESVRQAQRRDTRAEGASPAAGLTDRQTEILALMAKGQTNAQIAGRIGFSESTVRQETMAIYRFLDVEGRREAAQAATARGLV